MYGLSSLTGVYYTFVTESSYILLYWLVINVSSWHPTLQLVLLRLYFSCWSLVALSVCKGSVVLGHGSISLWVLFLFAMLPGTNCSDQTHGVDCNIDICTW